MDKKEFVEEALKAFPFNANSDDLSKRTSGPLKGYFEKFYKLYSLHTGLPVAKFYYVPLKTLVGYCFDEGYTCHVLIKSIKRGKWRVIDLDDGRYQDFKERSKTCFNAAYKVPIETVATADWVDIETGAEITGVARVADEEAEAIIARAKDKESIKDYAIKVTELETLVTNMGEKEKKLNTEFKKTKAIVSTLNARLKSSPAFAKSLAVEGLTKGKVLYPKGKAVMKSIKKILPSLEFKTDFEVITWEWETPHPDVPEVDPHYLFREEQTLAALYAAATNSRCWLYGDFGTGKTTLLLQLAALLGQPVKRINLDENLDTDELLGKTELTVNAEGVQVTQFRDGLIPTYMVQPYWVVADEYDASNSNVAYSMQALLENNKLTLLADGGRELTPHPMFRLFATGNTVGQGDERGMYQGIRPQSLAGLDRFTVWINMPMLSKAERRKLLRSKVTSLTEEQYSVIENYVTEHLKAYEMTDIIQPISMRGMVGIAEAAGILGDTRQAIMMVAVNKANLEDYAVLSGLVDKVCA